MSVMQELHDSEINCGVSCFFDGCWTAFIGDDLNGKKFVCTTLGSLEACEEWLSAVAVQNYPDSEFARSRRGG